MQVWGVTLVTLQARRMRQWEHSRTRNAGLSLAQYRALPRVQLVCCAVWQAVTTLPHVCTPCGRTYLAPAREGR